LLCSDDTNAVMLWGVKKILGSAKNGKLKHSKASGAFQAQIWSRIYILLHVFPIGDDKAFGNTWKFGTYSVNLTEPNRCPNVARIQWTQAWPVSRVWNWTKQANRSNDVTALSLTDRRKNKLHSARTHYIAHRHIAQQTSTLHSARTYYTTQGHIA